MSNLIELEDHRPHISLYCKASNTWHIFPDSLIANIAEGMDLTHLNVEETQELLRTFATVIACDYGILEL